MLQTSGAIAMSDVAVELGLASTANLTLDDSRVRKLAKLETAGSAIGLADLYGKANLKYTIMQSAQSLGSTWIGSQGSGWYSYGLCYDFTIDTPEGTVVNKARLYDSSNALISELSIVTTYSNLSNALLLMRPSGAADNTVRILYPYLSNDYYLHTYTALYRVELIDSNDNVYGLDEHRGFTFKAKRESAGSQPNSSTYLSNSAVKAWNNIEYQPNYP